MSADTQEWARSLRLGATVDMADIPDWTEEVWVPANPADPSDQPDWTETAVQAPGSSGGTGGSGNFTAIVSGGTPAMPSSGTVNVTAPSPLVSGDFLLAVASFYQNGGPAYAGVTSTGWTSAGSSLTALGSGQVLWKVAGASEPASYAFTGMGTNVWTLVTIINYRGASALDGGPGFIIDNSFTSFNLVAPSVTAAGPSRTLVCTFSQYHSGISLGSDPAGMTFRNQYNATNIHQRNMDQVVPAGATGTRTFVDVVAETSVGISVLVV